jgi:hypothetical protein
MADVPREAWDALLPPDGPPFLEWTFLETLERTGCAAPDKGWAPAHLTLWRGTELLAAAPAYVKSHSMGEFFYNDFRWPAVAAQVGVRYFPKLVVAVPFGPATGPRVLVAPGEDRAALTAALAQAAAELARAQGWSSVGGLFLAEADLPGWLAAGYVRGAGLQFHWTNRGYKSFDDFLARFSAKRRHMLKSERAQPARDGTRVRTIRGADLTPEVLAFASRCYDHTVEAHAWNAPHLNEAFFLAMGEHFAHRAEVVLAEEGGRPIAAAFNLRGDKRLYGRQWGAIEDRRFLHFNVCYYHSIERCIADGLEAFEPGAGGEHKMPRGFEPTLVHSAHWFADAALRAPLAAHLRREVAAYEAHVAEARAAGLAFRSAPKDEG